MSTPGYPPDPSLPGASEPDPDFRPSEWFTKSLDDVLRAVDQPLATTESGEPS